jgi:phage terminase large subunit-like protein
MQTELHTQPRKNPPNRGRGKSSAPANPWDDPGSAGGEVIYWIESTCYIPEGKLVGQKVVLADWQKAEICRIYDNPVGTRRAILSFGRKNAKTTLAAFLLLAHLCGPRARPNSQLYSAAQSREQAAIIFSLAAKIVRLSPQLRPPVVHVRDTAKELVCPGLGTRYRALSADATTAYGLSPVFIVHDELGQVRGPRSELYEALETATGAQEDPLSVVISTQAPTEADLLSVLIDDALQGNDPRVVVSLHTAPEGLDPFSEEAIKAANPAYGSFLNAREVLAMAEDARRMPSRESEYRNLVLNQRVEAVNLFVTPSVWKANGSPVGDLSRVPVWAGLDLSETADLTALVLIGQIDGIWHVKPTFWLPSEGLRERSRADRVQYDVWNEQGHLLTTPGSAIRYEYVAEYLRSVFDGYDVRKVAFDRWNMRHLKPWLEQAGFDEAFIEQRFEDFGQGTQSMSPALRALEEVLLDNRMAHGNHPVLSMCAGNATIEGKPGEKVDSSNRKLSKKRSRGRIDGMQALTMAFGVAPLKTEAPLDPLAMIF